MNVAKKSKAKRTNAKRKPAKRKRKTKAPELRRDVLVTIKVTETEADFIYHAADKYADGNMSRFLRHAAKACKTKAPAIKAKKSS